MSRSLRSLANNALCRIMTLYDAIMAISLREAANEAVARLGYDRGMKEEQLEITTKFLSGRDVFAILPTGFGKSLCYACLPLAFQLLEGNQGKQIVIVVTPLTAIMKDQVIYCIF